MMDLIETGEPVTRTALRHLGDWAVWVTLLLGLARGSGVLGAEASREFLLERFDGLRGGLPKGVRVYAARVADYREPAEPAVTRYTLALRGDSRVMLGPDNQPRGLSIRTGPLSASESIGLGLRCSSSDAPAPPDPATSSGSSRLRHRWGWNLSGRSATLSRLSSRPRSA